MLTAYSNPTKVKKGHKHYFLEITIRNLISICIYFWIFGENPTEINWKTEPSGVFSGFLKRHSCMGIHPTKDKSPLARGVKCRSQKKNFSCFGSTF